MTQAKQDKNPRLDIYNIALLKKILNNIGYDMHYFSEIENTMSVSDKYAQAHLENAPVVITDHQTKGLGREKRIWYDTPGCSIMFSALFQIKEANIACFADLIALKACQTLKKITGNKLMQIQYPNDLVYNDKKLGGILVKNVYDDKFHYVGTNIGIGINAHYEEEELSKFSTDYQATSLDIITGVYVKRQDILIELLDNLRYLNLEADVIAVNSHSRRPFEKQWKQASSFLGRQIMLLEHNQPFQEGKVVDTELGRGIQIQTPKGRHWFSLFETDMKARILA